MVNLGALGVEAVAADIEPMPLVADGLRQSAHVFGVGLENDAGLSSPRELPGDGEPGRTRAGDDVSLLQRWSFQRVWEGPFRIRAHGRSGRARSHVPKTRKQRPYEIRVVPPTGFEPGGPGVPVSQRRQPLHAVEHMYLVTRPIDGVPWPARASRSRRARLLQGSPKGS